MTMIDETHDPAAKSWVAGANDHPHFPVQNLPLGVFSPPGGAPRGGMAIGEYILDLAAMAPLLSGGARAAAQAAALPRLNKLLAMEASARGSLRKAVIALLTDPAKEVEVAPMLHQATKCSLHLPATIGDYTDFYTGIHHAENVGRLFRPDNPLLPNYKFVPIGYHGRASSIRLSGHDVIRPHGQIKASDAATPEYAPCRRLDYELEMGIWIGQGNDLGQPIAVGEAGRHVAGLSILNDWSARDIQAWEYQPLGPFLAKNFQSSISPWIITSEALAPYRVAQPARSPGDPEPLPYLMNAADQLSGAYAVTMEVYLHSLAMRTQGLAPHRLSRGGMTAMYWTAAQLIAHHSSNGCNLSPRRPAWHRNPIGSDGGQLGQPHRTHRWR